MKRHDVLIVGAGPTGLALALWLARQGIGLRIIDKASGPGTTSRAMAVQARILELYRQLDIAEAVAAAGHRNPAINVWTGGKRRAHLSLGTAGATLTPYPFVLFYPQDHHERLLISRLQAFGIEVERDTELIDFAEAGDHVTARLRGRDGEQRCEARYIAGCDGAHSAVRHTLGTGFVGGTYRHMFYVADVEASGLAAGEAHVAFAHSDFVALLPYGTQGPSRLIGAVRDERAERGESLTFHDVAHQAIESLGLRIEKVNWFSTYRVHHRLTDHFRHGRAFLLGDAAHVHSPVGGQGMNTGLGDAINLAWKLAAVLRDGAPDSLLDSFETERHAFARRLVETTDRVFTVVTSETRLADFVRTRIAPQIANLAFRIPAVREAAFRTVSQLLLNYRESPLSQGKAGEVQGGDRLPWVAQDRSDNHAPLSAIAWQVHVYGAAPADLEAWCAQHAMPLHVYAWRPEHGAAGFARDAAYLMRPDTYVALADPQPSAAALTRYFAALGYVPRAVSQ